MTMTAQNQTSQGPQPWEGQVDNIGIFQDGMTNTIVVISVSAVVLLFIVHCIASLILNRSLIFKNMLKILERPSGVHPYLLMIKTGARKGAGICNGTVQLKLSGVSGSHQLDLPTRDKYGMNKCQHVFTRDSNRQYLLHTDAPLGDMDTVAIQINSDDHQKKWFVSYVVVLDLMIGKQWYFPCHTWLDVPDVHLLSPDSHRKTWLLLDSMWKCLGDVHLWTLIWNPCKVMHAFHQVAYILLFMCLVALLMLLHMFSFTGVITASLPTAWIVDSYFFATLATANVVVCLVIGLLQLLLGLVRVTGPLEFDRLKRKLLSSSMAPDVNHPDVFESLDDFTDRILRELPKCCDDSEFLEQQERLLRTDTNAKAFAKDMARRLMQVAYEAYWKRYEDSGETCGLTLASGSPQETMERNETLQAIGCSESQLEEHPAESSSSDSSLVLNPGFMTRKMNSGHSLQRIAFARKILSTVFSTSQLHYMQECEGKSFRRGNPDCNMELTATSCDSLGSISRENQSIAWEQQQQQQQQQADHSKSLNGINRSPGASSAHGYKDSLTNLDDLHVMLGGVAEDLRKFLADIRKENPAEQETTNNNANNITQLSELTPEVTEKQMAGHIHQAFQQTLATDTQYDRGVDDREKNKNSNAGNSKSGPRWGLGKMFRHLKKSRSLPHANKMSKKAEYIALVSDEKPVPHSEEMNKIEPDSDASAECGPSQRQDASAVQGGHTGTNTDSFAESSQAQDCSTATIEGRFIAGDKNSFTEPQDCNIITNDDGRSVGAKNSFAEPKDDSITLMEGKSIVSAQNSFTEPQNCSITMMDEGWSVGVKNSFTEPKDSSIIMNEGLCVGVQNSFTDPQDIILNERPPVGAKDSFTERSQDQECNIASIQADATVDDKDSCTETTSLLRANKDPPVAGTKLEEPQRKELETQRLEREIARDVFVFLQDYNKSASLPAAVIYVVFVVLACLAVASLTLVMLLGYHLSYSEAWWWLCVVAISLVADAAICQPLKALLVMLCRTYVTGKIL